MSIIQSTTMGSSQESWFLYLCGFFLLFSSVFANPSSIFSNDRVQERATGNSINPEHYRVNFKPVFNRNFTGIRSVFQWTIDNTTANYGIHNAMQFSVNYSEKSQLYGQIGIYSNGSTIGIHFSLDSEYTYDASFPCLNDWKPNGKFSSCYYLHSGVTSNGIYFIDVEINNRTLSGYISQPQTNLTNVDALHLERRLIGQQQWYTNLTGLTPENYWVTNYFGSCNLISGITTYNYPPRIYNNIISETVDYTGSVYAYSKCRPLNTLAMTDWNTVLYISRPPPVINGTSSAN